MSPFLRCIARRRHATAATSASILRSAATSRMLSTLPRLPLFEAVSKHDPDSKVVVHSISGRTFKYGELLGDVSRARGRIAEAAGRQDLNGERIAFLVENSYDY
ncbi:hypothetical protein NXS19_000354 [Fusarium pseudograminearum]|nr:hypothetical protein NXS19_000354 [Fusarium pseudograminearum]